jgi:lipoprotein-anchoring transpeptidase ErfK/SrfK
MFAVAVPSTGRSEEPFPVFASEPEQHEYKFRRREVDFKTDEAPGTVVVDTQKFFLYFVLPAGRALRYGIGVGRTGKRWSGEAKVASKATWPIPRDWQWKASCDI